MSKQTRQDIALSYDRFSDPTQALGDSESRQQRAFASFCERHHLRPNKEFSFIDRGVSGHRGKHVAKGKLGRVLELAKAGAFKPKDGQSFVLVVEAWDRLGRMRPDKQIALLSSLLRTGLKIGVCRLDDIFSEADFGTHKFTTLSVFCQLAYEESRQKSERVAASWQQRKLLARQKGTVATGRLPAWITRKGGKLVLNKARAKVIQRIYELAGSGYGHVAIVKTLTAEGVKPFGEKAVHAARTRSQFSGRWTRPYVALLLRDRRVLGEYAPMKTVIENDEEKELPDGPPIKNYYPAAVTEEEFLRARAAQKRRSNNTGGRTRQAKYCNTFAGLLRCANDGGGWILHNKGTAKEPSLSLVNLLGNEGRGPTLTFPYPIFERGVLENLKEISPEELSPNGTASTVVDGLKAKVRALTDEIECLKDDLRQHYSRAATEVLSEKETELGALQEQLDTAQAEQLNPLSDDWKRVANLADAIETADDPTDARIRLRAILTRAIKTIHVLVVRHKVEMLCEVQVDFVTGFHRWYLLRYRPAANQRVGFWQVMSERWDEQVLPTCDLSDPAEVQQAIEGLTHYLTGTFPPDGSDPTRRAIDELFDEQHFPKRPIPWLKK